MRNALRALVFLSLVAPGCDDDTPDDSEAGFRDGSTCGGRTGEPGIIAIKSLDASGTPLVEGPDASIFSNGAVVVSGTADLYGDVVSGKTVTLNG